MSGAPPIPASPAAPSRAAHAAVLVRPAAAQHRLAGADRRRLVAAVVWYLVDNTARNLDGPAHRHRLRLPRPHRRHPDRRALIDYNPAVSTYGRALLIGVLNTLKVSVVGIVLATILGTLIGIGRLSRNWLLARLTAVYVEVIRDIPVLLQLLFWYALLQGLPAPRQALQIGEPVFLSNRGIKVPLLDLEAGASLGAGGLRAGRGRHRRCGTARRHAAGARPASRPPVWPVALGPADRAAGCWCGRRSARRSRSDMPVLRGFNFQGGGTDQPGIRRAADRAGDLHRRLHRRDRALRHPGGAAGPVGGGRRARAAAAARCCGTSCCRRRCG